MRLILFDIDGTLVDTGGAGSRSLNLAFYKLFSIENAFHGISMAGKTDSQIIREGLLKHNFTVDSSVDNIIEAYLWYLQGEMNNDKKKIKPGIYDVLNTLRTKDDFALGLLTGNLEKGARIKLHPFKLNEYFSTGAFGSDDDDRNNLLPIAVKRYEELLQHTIRIEESIIVGDTPRDIECAHIYGATCIAVATGPYSYEELVNAGANFVVHDFSDKTAISYFM
jgi:phosphoglycolate phosphatase-like HAD superfamily hydrolase